MMTSGRAALLLVALLVSGCGPAARPPSAVAHFDVSGERFQVVVSDAATIDVLRRLERGEPAPSIPNGRLVRGSGNEPWHWRLEDIQMADVTTELCDGRRATSRRTSTSSSQSAGTARGRRVSSRWRRASVGHDARADDRPPHRQGAQREPRVLRRWLPSRLLV